MALYHHIPTREAAIETVRIISSDQGDGYTLYVIQVTVPPYKWLVKHRYSKFHELHEKLTTQYNVKKSLLPPKKLFGKQSESFIQQRQMDLESYLHTILQLFSDLPPPITEFLDFPHYEVIDITEVLAEKLYFQGDQLLASEGVFEMSPLELNALNTRMGLPEPTCASGDKKKDLGHVLDFISQLQHLCIKGSNQPVGTSDIIPNLLSFDLTYFRSLQTLQIEECNITGQLKGLESVRQTAKTLMIHKSLTDLKQFLLCDDIHWTPSNCSTTWPAWTQVSHVDLSHNSLQHIDPAIRLLSTVEFLDLSHNLIRQIENLETLPRLSVLNLAQNQITHVDSLHTKLGNVHTLCLSANSISSLSGFSRLYSLVQLDLSSNQVEQVSEVSHLKGLPCLELLTLTHNPVTTVIDYRANILLAFGNRCSELTLDGRKPSQKELDTVAILQALQLAREGRVWHQTREATSFSSFVQVQGRDTISINSADEVTEDMEKPEAQDGEIADMGGGDVPELMDKMESVMHLDQEYVQDVQKTTVVDEVPVTACSLESKEDASVSDNTNRSESMSSNDKLSPSIEKSFACIQRQASIDQLSDCEVPVNHGRKVPIKGGEMMIPETLLAVDVGDPHFRVNLQTVLLKALKNTKDKHIQQQEHSCFKHAHEGNTLWWSAWGVSIFGQTLAWQRIPCCLALSTCCIQVLQLQDIHQQMEPLMLQPDLSPVLMINPANVTSVNIGPRKAYVEVNVGATSNRGLTCIFLVTNTIMADTFLSKLLSVYGIVAKPKYTERQFESLLLQDLNGMPNADDANSRGKVLFCERILVSRSHRICGGGNSINYLVITPSKLMIIEEVLLLPQVFGHGTCGSPFKVNLIASVKDEIANMHVHDRNSFFSAGTPNESAAADSEFVNDTNANGSCPEEKGSDALEAVITKEVEDIKTCCILSELHLTGYWMYIKFCNSRCQIHVRFLTRQARSHFLEAFLKARNE